MNENSNSKFVLYCLLWVHPVFFDQTGCRRSKANRPLAVECCFKTTALRKSSIGGIAAPQSFNRKYGMLPASSGFLPAIENPRHDAAGTASGSPPLISGAVLLSVAASRQAMGFGVGASHEFRVGECIRLRAEFRRCAPRVPIKTRLSRNAASCEILSRPACARRKRTVPRRACD